MRRFKIMFVIVAIILSAIVHYGPTIDLGTSLVSRTFAVQVHYDYHHKSEHTIDENDNMFIAMNKQ